MWHVSKGWRASLLALALVGASASQSSGQVTPQQVQETGAATAPASAVPQLTSADVNAWLDGFMPLARGMRDAADLPRLTQILWDRGWRRPQLAKVLGGNALGYLERHGRPCQ